MDNENGPPLKRVKQEIESPPGSSRMIVYNDTRKTTNAVSYQKDQKILT